MECLMATLNQLEQNYGFARLSTARGMAKKGKPPAAIRRALAEMDRKQAVRMAAARKSGAL